MDSQGYVKEDPHGMVEVFAESLEAGLKRMHPEAAFRGAVAAVDSYLKGSEFIDMNHKGSSEPQYIRVDKRPERRGGTRAGIGRR